MEVVTGEGKNNSISNVRTETLAYDRGWDGMLGEWVCYHNRPPRERVVVCVREGLTGAIDQSKTFLQSMLERNEGESWEVKERRGKATVT